MKRKTNSNKNDVFLAQPLSFSYTFRRVGTEYTFYIYIYIKFCSLKKKEEDKQRFFFSF